MTRYEQGPSDRFNEIDGYYQRDPSTVNLRTDEELRVFMVHLHTLFEGINLLAEAVSPEQIALVRSLKAEVLALVGGSKLLLALFNELRTYNDYLHEQRQSARKAFEAGYEARLTDILTQLHPTDRKALEWVVKFVDRQEKEAESHDVNRLQF